METILPHLAVQFEIERSSYDRLVVKFRELFKEVLSSHNIITHSIDGRCKSIDSLRSKVDRKKGKYTCLGDITDLAGLRIITYFQDDVDRIASVIEREFDIDVLNSIDKRKSLEPDRFGYMSLHYVVGLKANRLELPEYKAFFNKKCEVQVRSILQHAWAEIEHDIGYKSAMALPDEVRRRFAMVAGTLELLDGEFARLRTHLKELGSKASAAIEAEPTSVPIDAITLAAFMNQSEGMRAFNQALNIEVDDIGAISIQLLANWLGKEFSTIAEIEAELVERHSNLVAFRCCLGAVSFREPKDTAVVMLLYSRLAMQGIEKIQEFLSQFGFTATGVHRISKELMTAYSKMSHPPLSLPDSS